MGCTIGRELSRFDDDDMPVFIYFSVVNLLRKVEKKEEQKELKMRKEKKRTRRVLKKKERVNNGDVG